MKAQRNNGKTRKQAVNLTLSGEIIRKARVLKKHLNRPSLSNLVEHLIIEADQRKEKVVGA